MGDFTEPTKLRIVPSASSSIDKSEHQVTRMRLSQRLTTGLQTLARQHHLTTNTILLGAWAMLLARYSGEDDVVFGTVLSGRPVDLPGVETMVGLFINALPMRVRIEAHATLNALLDGIQHQHMQLREVEYSSLADVQRWSGIARGTPLFETLIVYENYPGAEAGDATDNDSQEMEEFARSFERTNYPLTLIVVPGRQMTIEAAHDTRCFDTPAIERLLDHLQTLLAGMVAQPQAKLSQLPLLTPGERRQLLVEWNATQAEYPQQCLHELVQAQARRDPEAVAVVFGEEQLSYGELEWRANQVAHWLHENGVQAETLVGLCVERSLEMVVGLLGILKAGGAYVPLDPQYPTERLRYMLEDANVALLLTQQALAPRIPKGNAKHLLLDQEWAQVAALPGDMPPPSESTPDNLAYVIYTSGSTGTPKGIEMPQRPLMNLIAWQLRQANFLHESRAAQLAPLSFDVSFQEIFSTLCSGGSLVLIPQDIRADPAQLLALLNRQGVSRLFLPPIALQQLAIHVQEHPYCELPNLSEVITAGEQLKATAALKTLFERLPGCALTNQYGPSETHVVTSHTLTGPPRHWPALPPIGGPIDNARAYLLDSQMRPAPVGVAAELYIAGTSLARGYLGKPEQTVSRFIASSLREENSERLYRTGDIAYRLPDGKLQFVGRCDDQVKVRGYRIELGEIESVLAQHPGVKDCAVAVLDDLHGNRCLAAYVVLRRDTPADAAALRPHLQANLPDFMLPTAFHVIESLPMTPSGKVDHKVLLAMNAPAVASMGEVEGPRNEIESLLCKLWEEALGLPVVSVSDNFFELGGHSLLATRLVSRIRAALDLDVPISSLFESPTVADLAEKIEEQLVDEALHMSPVQDVVVDPQTFSSAGDSHVTE